MTDELALLPQANLSGAADSTDRFLTEKYRMSSEGSWLAFNYAWRELVESAAIIGMAHGRGRRKTWRLKA